MNVERSEAEEIMDAYFEQFGGVADFLEEVVKQAHRDGFTTTMFGRRRYLPELGSGNPRMRAIGERQALNAPIQGSAADIMKLAMIAVDDALTAEGLGTKMILTVHDELLFEAPETAADETIAVVREKMEHAVALKVPLTVDVGVGKNWKEAKS